MVVVEYPVESFIFALFIEKIAFWRRAEKLGIEGENINEMGKKKVPNFAARDYLCVRCEDGFKKLVMKQITHRYLHTLRFSL